MLQRKSIIIGMITLALYGTVPAWSYNNPAFIRGKDAMATGDWDGAVSAFGEALGMNPTDPEALSLRGACFYKMGNYKLAIEDLDNSLNYAPNNLRGLLLRGTCHAQLGHDAMAIIDYEQAIRMDPDLAKKYFAARSSNGAQQNDSLRGDAALGSLTGQKPDGSEGLNLFAIQDYKDAMTNVYPNGFVDMDNADNDTIKNRGGGNPAYSSRRGSQRKNANNQANNQRSNHGSNQQNNLATNLGSTRGPGFKGDYGSPFGAGDNREGSTARDATFVGRTGQGQVGATQAIAPPGKAGTGMLDNTAGMPSINSDAANNSALESNDTINPRKDHRLVSSLDQDPNRSEIGPLAGAGVFPGNPHRAIIDYTQALGLDPTNGEYYFRRAKAYQKLNKVNEAMEDFQHAINQEPNNARYYIGRASLFYQLGKTILLQADIESARNCDPDLPTKIHFYVPPLPKDATWAGDGAN
jgi:tetratricopeptide (TPR) repeat protein